MAPDIFEILNATLYLRYSLMPYLYTQLYKATVFGTIPIRPLAFE
jgi:alpha-glucosidase (family GH31 glycosyl hydrolase)